MAPPTFDWWSKEKHRGTPVVVKMENPIWSISEISSPEDVGTGDDFPGIRKGGKGKNAKQITWVLLLKAHRAAGCLTYLASAAIGLASVVRRRVSSGRTDSDTDSVASPADECPSLRRRLYSCIKIFLWLSIFLLAFEVAAYLKGWHITAPDLHSLPDIHGISLPSSLAFRSLFGSIYSGWLFFRAEYIAPPLQFLANACVILFLIQSADRFILCLGCFWIRFKRIKPVTNYIIKDLEAGEYLPMVLIQIPMCNEREVYQQSIAAVCSMDWPRSNMLIQVLDDSDNPTTQTLIREEVEKWEQSGVPIVYRHRVIRDGYKAGNLKSAMNCSYVKDYEFVVIFDADFQPTPDFLKKTVPHFKVKQLDCII